MKKRIAIFVVILLVVFGAALMIKSNNSPNLPYGDKEIASQKAKEFAEKKYNYVYSANFEAIKLQYKSTSWEFHVPEESDSVAGCGSLFNMYSIDKYTYKIKDISYNMNGPC